MNIKSISFVSKHRSNSKKRSNAHVKKLRMYSKMSVKKNKIMVLLSAIILNILPIYAAKDNLYNVTTFAGSGTAGFTNGTGTSATFSSPGNITINYSTGDLYVADWNNYVIRKITPAGVVTTFAGTAGKSGNTNNTGTAAKFSKMRGIACDSSGNLYLADYGNNAIRKITPTGTVSTFAGVASVHGITVDSSNNVYASTLNNNSIYKIKNNGTISILAGKNVGSTNGTGTAAKFKSPASITTNSSDIIVADQSNNLIRKITISKGTVTTIAGGGSTGGTAAGSANGTGTTATFNNPTGIYYDKSGNLYVADQASNLIRKITSAGVVTTITSSKNDLKLNAPRDVVLDNTGAIYIADLGNNRILKLIPNYIGPGSTDTVLTSTDYGSYESVNLAGGIMQVGAAGLKIGNNVMLAANTTSTINTTNPSEYITLLVMSGSGALTINGTGILILSGTNTYTGVITINSGSQLQFGLGGPTGSVASSSIVNNGMIQFGTSGSTSCTANISGTGGLWKSISGTLTLTGTNTYTGSTNINPSPNNQTNAVLIGDISKSVGVNIENTCAYDLNGTARTLIDPRGSGTIQSSNSNATLTLTAQNGSTFSGTIASSINGLNKTRPGTLILSGTNNMPNTAITTINTGTLQIGAGSTTGTISGNRLVNNGVLSFNRSNEYTYSGIISGIGTIAQSGTGKTLLRGANTYTGGTIINAGILNITTDNNLGSGEITLSGGALQANADLTLTQPIRLTTEGTIGTSTYSVKASGNISGSNSFRKNGAGRLIFTGTNTYTGATTITGGTLQIGEGSTRGGITSNSIINNAALSFNRSDAITYSGIISGTGTLQQAGSGTLTLTDANTYTGVTTITGGKIQIGTCSTTGSIASSSIVNNAALSFNRSDAYTYTGVISGTGSVTNESPNTLTLSGANTYTGATSIAGGGTIIGNISTSIGVAVAGTYDLNGTACTLIDPSGSGIIKSSNSNAALTLTSKNGSTFSGSIANTISNLIINGPKTLALSETNTYTGTTLISAGSTLMGDISTSVGVTVSGTYDLNGTTRTLINLTGAGTIQSSGDRTATLTVTTQNNSTFSGTIASSINGLNKTGPGTLILSGTNNMQNTAITTINTGTLQIGAGSTTGTISGNSLVNNGVLSFNKSNNYTYSGIISGTGTVTQHGSGKTLLRGANTYIGGTIVNAGTLNITAGKNLGSGAITLSGGNLQANANLTLTQPIRLTTEGTIGTSIYSVKASGNITGSHSFRKNGTGTLTLIGTNTYTGATTIAGGTLQIGAGSKSGSIASSSVVNNAALSFNRSNNYTYSGIISGTGILTKAGSGTLILTGANTYAGVTTIAGGKIQIGAGSTIGNIASSSIVNNAALSFNRSDAYTYTGVISGTGTLQQVGSGTLTVAGANTYTGATTIDTGKTLIGNISTSAGVTVSGTYDLNGTACTLIDPSGAGIIQSSGSNEALTLTSKNGSTFSGTIANTINVSSGLDG